MLRSLDGLGPGDSSESRYTSPLAGASTAFFALWVVAAVTIGAVTVFGDQRAGADLIAPSAIVLVVGGVAIYTVGLIAAHALDLLLTRHSAWMVLTCYASVGALLGFLVGLPGAELGRWTSLGFAAFGALVALAGGAGSFFLRGRARTIVAVLGPVQVVLGVVLVIGVAARFWD